MIAELIVILFLSFICLTAFFVVAIFPLWMMADCAGSRSIPGASKMLWIIGIVAGWPFGSLAYASFASQKRSLAKLSNQLVALIIAVSLVFSAGIYYFRVQALPAAVTRYQRTDLKEIPKEQQEIIKADLAVLQHEMQANSFFSPKSLIALQLFEWFQSMTMNSKTSVSEWGIWQKQVADRERIKEESLPAYVAALNKKTIQNLLMSRERS